MRVRFGDCLLDTDARTLMRGRRSVDLSPKALLLLTRLLEARPRALSQRELRDVLWPSTNVGHTSLARVVTELRHAIGDRRAEARFVRTVHGFGYAFSGEAMEEDAASTHRSGAPSPCTLLWDAREVRLQEGENFIGRSRDCLICVDSPLVSRRHARVLVDGKEVILEDLNSKNGTHLGGRRIGGPTALHEGDEIKVGPAVLVFRGPGGEDTTRTE